MITFLPESKTMPYGLLVARVTTGALMLTHGFPKLMNFSEYASQFPDLIGIGSMPALALTVFAEFFCSIALILGLYPRFAATFGFITMLVAAFVAHKEDPLAKKEMALLFATLYFVIITAGGGAFCLRKENA